MLFRNPETIVTMQIGNRKYRYLTLIAAGAVCLALTIAAFLATQKWDLRKIQDEFERMAFARHSALKKELELNLHALTSVQFLYVSSQYVDRAEFGNFAKHLLGHYPGIQALEWVPRIVASRREAYENATKREGFPDFQITERTAQGKMVRAGERREYFPVMYVEPGKGNERALGFDLASDAARGEALSRARDTGNQVATTRLTLVQEVQGRFGSIVFAPIYKKGVPTDTVNSRRSALEGFALGVFRIGDIVEAALAELKLAGIDVTVSDVSAPESERVLYSHLSRTRAGSSLAEKEGPETETKFDFAQTFDVAGRTWTARYSTTPDFISTRRTRDPWIILFVGLLFTVLFTAYLFVTIRRSMQIERFAREHSLLNEQLQQDIVERTQMESKLLDAAHEWRATFDAIKDPVLLLDDQQIIVRCNSAFSRIAGLPFEKILGRKYQEVFQQAWKTVEKNPFLSIQNRNEWTSVDFFLGDRIYEVVAHPIMEQGRITASVQIMTDITERKQTELLRIDKEAAEAANRAKSGFLANMSHELRTPLNSVLGFSRVLKKGMYGPLNDKQMEYAGYIEESGEHLLNLINDILDLAKVEAGKMELDASVVSVAPLLKGAVAMFREKALKQGIKLTIDLDADANITIKADGQKLKQILFNLLSNAIKFTPDGGRVRVSARMISDCPRLRPSRAGSMRISDSKKEPEQPAIEISVSDTGPGIKPEDRDRLFQEFSQLDSTLTKAHEGTGLGLALSRKLVTLHGGSIGVESEYGKGSKFTFTIPCSPLSP